MDANLEIQDRLAILINTIAKNPNAFSVSIGTPSTQIYNIIKGKRNKPSFDLLVKICRTYPQVDLDWLVLGKGQMLRGENGHAHRGSSKAPNNHSPETEVRFQQLIESLEQEKEELHNKYDQLKDKYIEVLEKQHFGRATK